MPLKDKNTRQEQYTRRAFLLGGLQAGVLCVLAGRLGYLQLVKGQDYKTLSDKNRINLKILAPSRGEIVDRYGVPLAINAQNFRVLITPEQSDDIKQSLKNLRDYIQISDRKIERILEQSKRNARFIPLEVEDGLSWEEVTKLEVNISDLPGIEIEEGEIRNYPLGPSTAHLVGYVGAVTRGELDQNDDKVLSLPGFQIGKTGLERAVDQDLRGKAGQAEVEVNVVGREIRELKRQSPRGGQRTSLSIDAELQQFVQSRLSLEKSASAVIMDTKTGAVYALASVPGFDPNMFVRGIGADIWEELLNNQAAPLTNKAISGLYPPASTFKMISALAYLESGKANRYTRITCTGHYDYGRDRFHCWKGSGHGSMNVIEALAESCDIYFYKLATEVGIEKIAEMARKFGLHQTYDFDLLEERKGLIPDQDWKRANFGNAWQPGETIVASIGQGYIQATPLQMAVMTARLVNGGLAVKPWMIATPERVRGLDWGKIDISQENLNIIKAGMNLAVNHETGTAFGSRLTDVPAQMGGKTGTAQVKRITAEQRRMGVKNEDLPWKSRHHALFTAYAPLRSPRYACCVVVEHGVGGSRTAAPIAKDIMTFTLKRDPAQNKIAGFEQDYPQKPAPKRKPEI